MHVRVSCIGGTTRWRIKCESPVLQCGTSGASQPPTRRLCSPGARKGRGELLAVVYVVRDKTETLHYATMA